MVLEGLFLILCGGLLRALTVRYCLKENASWRIKSPGRLVTTGAYKYVRHPLYFGGLLMCFGLGLALANIGTAVCLTWVMLNFYMDRIDREERILLDSYGKAYLDYAMRTKMLIPWVL